MATQVRKTHEMDMCNGPLFSKIVVFFIPVMLSNMLQLVYNAADQIIVGKFAGATALAAVGSTASLINLITCFLMGLSVGASSVTARHFGAGNKQALSRTVHTSIASGLGLGVILGVVGIIISKPLLVLMGSPKEVLDGSTLYMMILFAGLPAMALFNFSAAILRAIGDTKRPMIHMVLSGLINVALNLLFVIVFKMAVAGVALATVISQIFAAIMAVRCLIHTDADYKLRIKNIKIHKGEFKQLIQIGVPSGIQSAAFSLSNVFIQSAVNSFGAAGMAGCTAAANVDNLIYQATNSLYHTVLSFAGQNYGAGKKKRIIKSVWYCGGIVVIVGFSLGMLFTLFGEMFLGLFMDKGSDPKMYEEALRFGMERLRITCPIYFMCGVMEIGTGTLRAINKSALSMFASLIGACGLRILWIFTIFAANPSVFTLFMSYPITWSATSICLFAMLIYYMKKMRGVNDD